MIKTFPSGKPLVPGPIYSDGGTTMSLGIVVIPLVAAQATALRYFAAAGVTVRPRIWSRDGVVLASGPPVVCAAGWNTLPLSTPYEMATGVDVIAGVFQTGGTTYTAKAAFPILSPAIMAQYGRFRMDEDAISQVDPARLSWYGVDIVITIADDAVEEPPVVVVPPQQTNMDPAELAIHIENTAAYIDYRPSVITLTPIAQRVRTAGGGWRDEPGTPRAPQKFRIIELGMSATPPVLKLQDGKERKQDFWLLALPDAAMAIGDSWTAEDGREWEIGDIVRPNGYEQRGLVAERGR